MAKEGYWEGWGFNDTFKVSLTGQAKDVSSAVKELKQAFPKNEVKKYSTKSLYVFVYDNEVPIVKKIAKMFNLKVSYETGGLAGNGKLVYVLYDVKDEADEILNSNGKRNRGWWQSNLNRQDSDQLLNGLKRRNLLLGFLIYTGDSSSLKFEQGGDIGEALASSNPYIGGAKVIQGIAPESVSALDKKIARKINPDPNRPIFFNKGGGVPRKMELHDAVLYKGKQYDISIKNNVVGLKNLSQGAWGSDYPFTPLSKVDIDDVTDMYGNKVEISDKYALGGKILASSSSKEGLNKIIEQYLYGSTITLVETENDKIYEVHNKKGKTPFYVEFKRGKYNFIQPTKYVEGGGVDINAPFGTLVSKNKRQKLEYKKVGSNVEFMIYEGVNNPVSNYSRTSFKKSKNGSRIMNYKEFLKFIHSNGFVADQKYALGGGVDDLEINKILKKLENHYLFGGRGLDLITDLEQVQNPQNTTYYETIARKDFFETQLYEWLKKYDIIGGFTIIWVGDLEIINNWKSKINELKSNGYLVVKKISAPTKNRTKHFRYIAIKQKFDNGGSVGQTDYSVAQTILNQLGGMKRLVVMTGAYNFVASTNAVSFRIKNRKVNYIKITLNGKDLYDVKFSRIFNYQEKVVAELNDIYFDQLIPIFEQNTGMYLKMFKKGGMVSTQNRDMVISQLKAIHHHQKEMLDTLKNSGEVEAWVLAKVSNASSDLSDIAHYLEFKE